MEEILEKNRSGAQSQESFTQVDKNRDVENGVRGQMMHLNPSMEKETPEEIGNWKTKAPKDIRKKNDRFISPS